MKIVAVTYLRDGFPMSQRVRALRNLGHEVCEIGCDVNESESAMHAFERRARYWLFRNGWDGQPLLETNDENARLMEQLERRQWDVLWLDRALTIDGKTVAAAKSLQKKCRIVGFCHDDVLARHSQSRQLLEQMPLFDLFITTKSYNAAELPRLGCKRCVFINNSYDPATHRPLSLTQADTEYMSDVTFVGAWEHEREELLLRLAQSGTQVAVWGSEWRKSKAQHSNLRVIQRDVIGDEYAKVISGSKIALGLLRRRNRDLQTTRSIEIPACGTMMLAERTAEHRGLFKEGVEAEFFESELELREKVRFYLANDNTRQKLACCGRQRCLTAGYSNEERLKPLLDSLISDSDLNGGVRAPELSESQAAV